MHRYLNSVAAISNRVVKTVKTADNIYNTNNNQPRNYRYTFVVFSICTFQRTVKL